MFPYPQNTQILHLDFFITMSVRDAHGASVFSPVSCPQEKPRVYRKEVYNKDKFWAKSMYLDFSPSTWSYFLQSYKVFRCKCQVNAHEQNSSSTKKATYG